MTSGTPAAQSPQPEPHPGPATPPPLPGPVEGAPLKPYQPQPNPTVQDTPLPASSRPASAPPASTPAGTPTSISGVMSSVSRNGRWTVPPVLKVYELMSEVMLDLREAQVSSDLVEIKIYGAMSDVKILVPPGVEVEWGEGASLMSDEKADQPGPEQRAPWRLRVTHVGMMSDITVRSLAAGERPTKKWWKRGG